jgi:cellulose synthase/poly-beta-1,6-N-acetylglucosamine synthase-like glycosyltransferase
MTTILLLLIFLSLLLFYLTFLWRIKTGLNRIISKQEKINENKSDKSAAFSACKASVIIPFRNESENILNNLRCIEEQDYPKEYFEVIYVDDSSTDGSAEKLIKGIKSPNVKVIPSEADNIHTAFKKFALKKGIQYSKGEILVTTDADALFGKNWLRSLLGKFDEDTGLVSGPVSFIYNDGIFSAFQVLEFAGLVLTGAGLIGIKKPVICNGANLAYRKKVYDEVNGFSQHLHLSSGEDELLMQSISKNTSFKIKFSWDSDSLVSTSLLSSFREFFQQRKRWASKSLFYPDIILRIKLFLIFLFYLGISLQFLLIFFYSKIFLLSFLITLAGKCFFEYLIIKSGEEFLFPGKILKYFLLSEILQIPYIIISAASGLSGKFKWKGRNLDR